MQAGSVLNTLFNPRYRYADSFDQMRARITLFYPVFAMIGSVLTLIGALAIPQNDPHRYGIIAGALLVGILPQILVIALVHLGQLRIATLITYIFLLAASYAALGDGVSSSTLMTMALPMLYASLIWRWRGTLVTLLLQAIGILTVGVLQSRHILEGLQPLSTEVIVEQVLIDLALLAGIGIVSGAAASELRRALHYTSRLVSQLRATSEIAQRTAALTDLNELLKQTVNYIRDRFGFYHVQIFLIDEQQRFATLQAATGDMGVSLLQRGFRLAVGSQGAIGQVTLLGEPILVGIDPDGEPGRRRDEVLPETRSELALPLIARDHILGVLDIQSARPNALASEDVESLSIMASHISIAINNAQLFQEQRAMLNDNRRLFLEAEANLRETQILNQRLTGEAWEEYIRSRASEVVGYTLSQDQIRHDETWTPMLQEASQKGRPVIMTQGDKQIIAVPVELRGRAIGAIEVETSGAGRQSDTLEMLQSVAQRLALSVDNARLFEQAQDLARQELQVNAISAKLQGATDMGEIVKTAIGELGRALGASQASIRVGLDLHNPALRSGEGAGSSNSGGVKEIRNSS